MAAAATLIALGPKTSETRICAPPQSQLVQRDLHRRLADQVGPLHRGDDVGRPHRVGDPLGHRRRMPWAERFPASMTSDQVGRIAMHHAGAEKATDELTNATAWTAAPDLVVDRPPVRVLKDECQICAVAGRPCGGHAMTCAVAGCSACMGVTWERAQ